MADLVLKNLHGGSVMHPPADAEANVVVDGEARALGERQAVLASAYPDEYVVLRGERVVAHSADREDAYAHYESAFDEAGDLEPIVVAPEALRRFGPPVVRGRALVRSNPPPR